MKNYRYLWILESGEKMQFYNIVTFDEPVPVTAVEDVVDFAGLVVLLTSDIKLDHRSSA